MSIAGRLKRLEAAVAGRNESGGQKTLDQAVAEIGVLGKWLAERGFADALAAVEAGETGPEGLGCALADAAESAYRQRNFSAIEKELDANRLPSEELMATWHRLSADAADAFW